MLKYNILYRSNQFELNHSNVFRLTHLFGWEISIKIIRRPSLIVKIAKAVFFECDPPTSISLAPIYAIRGQTRNFLQRVVPFASASTDVA